MKNLLLLTFLFLIGTSGYLRAQCPAEVNVSSNSRCLLVKWAPGEDPVKKPNFLQGVVDGDTVQYIRDGQMNGYFRYFIQGPGGPSGCDTTGMTSFSGNLDYSLRGGDFTCEYVNGEYKPECPDDVLISGSENCLIFMVDSSFTGNLPDSIRLNTSIFHAQEFDYLNPYTTLFLKDTFTVCDTNNMNTLLLSDTLFIGKAVCTYDNGLLPISILAFNYKNEDNGVALSWEVNSEEPTQKLYLQKSYDGVDWMNVYEQRLENYTSGQTMEGAFTDLSIEQPKLYYRLYISGYGGEEKYSNILPVAMKDQVINTLFYQSQSRSIMIKAGQNYTGEIHLINAQGQQVMVQKIQIQKNTYQEIDVKGHLTPGIYFVNFDNGLIPPSKIFID